jgi:hypothetical protein
MNWTPEQQEIIDSVIYEHNQYNAQLFAHTTPVAVRYGDKWEFFVRADYTPISGDYDEIISL